MSTLPTVETHLAHIALDGYAASEMRTIEVPLGAASVAEGDERPAVATLQLEVCDSCRLVTTTCLHDHCTWRVGDDPAPVALQDLPEDEGVRTTLVCDFCGLDCT